MSAGFVTTGGCGGHAKSKHVGKTDGELIDVLNADYVRKQSGNLEITDFRLAEGSFASLEQANELVNRVLQMNKDEVDQVAAGKKREATLQEHFEFVTGKEAFRPNGDSEPYIRATDSVRVVVRPYKSSWRGYRVHTAYRSMIGNDATGASHEDSESLRAVRQGYLPCPPA
jgi:Bacterial CdiA-CT RNAse A domain